MSICMLSDKVLMASMHKAEGLQPEEDARLLSLAINETNRAIFILDDDRRIVYANRAFSEWFEYSLAEVLGKRASEFLIGEKTDPAAIERVRTKAAEGQSFQDEILFYSKSGREIWISGTVNPICDEQGKVKNLVVVLADITETKNIQKLQYVVLEAVASGLALNEVADLLCRNVEEIAPEVTSSIVSINADGKLHALAGPSLPRSYAEALEGAPIGEKVGSCGTAAYRGVPVCVTDIETDPLWEDYKSLVLPLGLKACWSSPIKLRDGRVAGTFAFYYKEKRGPSRLHQELVSVCLHLCMLAMERDEARKKIAQLSHFDALTGLLNRASFYEMTNDLMSKSMGIPCSFFVLNLDRFKDVNTTLGHPMGDQILIEVAYRLQRLSKPHGIVARMSGDNFALFMPECGSSRAAAIADNILETLSIPIEGLEMPLSISAALGISVPDDGRGSPEIYLEQAVAALQQAKAEKRGCYRFYSPEMNQQAQERLILGAALCQAIKKEELHLEYQPQIRLKTNELAGVEALSRWTDAKLGVVPPGKFIPLAEETGKIVAIGYWSLREACRQMAKWREKGIAVPVVSVNLSPRQFESSNLPQFVSDLLSEYGLPAQCLTIEITENLMLGENPEVLSTVHALHSIGCGISVDDFGTGFSNLSRLTQLPITELKLDQSFMQNFEEDPSAQAIATAVIRIGQSLGMEVVAESVETEAQQLLLQELGCDVVQGFLRARPMTAKDLEDWIATNLELSPSIPAA